MRGERRRATDTAAANSFDCTFPDGPATSTVKVTADDGDPTNNVGSDEIDVTVANVAPTVELTGAESANEGETKTYHVHGQRSGCDTFRSIGFRTVAGTAATTATR